MKFCILIGANTLGIHFLPLHCIEGIDLDKEEGNCIFLSFNLFFILQTMIKKKRHNSYQSGLYVKSSLIQNHIGCMYNKHFYLNIFKIGIPNIPPKVTFSYSLHHLSFWQFPPNQFFRSITLVSSFIALFSKQLPQIYLQNLAALPLNYIQNKTTSEYPLYHVSSPNHSLLKQHRMVSVSLATQTSQTMLAAWEEISFKGKPKSLFQKESEVLVKRRQSFPPLPLPPYSWLCFLQFQLPRVSVAPPQPNSKN